MARKALSKKTRFEVFKRDSFTCQYCGKSAPDVVLNVDHIIPVVSGGDNAALNLVTACFDCNSGKGKRELSDHAVVHKQMDQMKLLNERKNQIQMIAEWRAGLADLENTKLEALRDAINKHLFQADKEVADHYLRTDLKASLARFGLDEALSAVEKSANQYLKDPNNLDHRQEFLNKIPRIAYWAHHEKQNPEIAEIRKIAFVARKKWAYCDPKSLTPQLLRLNREHGLDSNTLYSLVLSSSGIMRFNDAVAAHLGGKRV